MQCLPSVDGSHLVSLPLLLLEIAPYTLQDCAWPVLLKIEDLQPAELAEPYLSL